MLSGIGGMGKSELLRFWIHEVNTKKCFDHIIFLTCNQGIDSAISNNKILCTALDIEVQEPDKLNRFCFTLNNQFKGKILLALDDLPTSTINQTSNELYQLSSLQNTTLIATSRYHYEFFDNNELAINTLEAGKIIELYENFRKKPEDHAILSQIINLAGGHTLTIELLAKTAYQKRWDAEQLLEQLQKHSFSFSYNQKNLHYQKDAKSQYDNLANALAKLFVIAELGEAEKFLLFQLSCLNSQVFNEYVVEQWFTKNRTKFSFLERIRIIIDYFFNYFSFTNKGVQKCLKQEKQNISILDSLNKLVESGWVEAFEKESGTKSYSLHQTITYSVHQSYMQCIPEQQRYYNLVSTVTRMNDFIKNSHFTSQDNECLPALSAYLTDSVNHLSRQSMKDKELVIDIVLRFNTFCIEQGLFSLSKELLQSINSQNNPINLQRLIGENHSLYISYLNNFAGLYQSVGEFPQALLLFEQALQRTKAQVGENHLAYAHMLNNLAVLHELMGEYQQALMLHKKALKIRKIQLRENHPHYATSLTNLAGVYQSMGKYEQALTLYKKALQIRKTQLGENHSDYANSLNNLALLYWNRGEHQQSLPLYEQALDVWKSQLGENHPEYATTLNNLALVYQDIGEYEQAFSLHEQAMQIRKSKLGEYHSDYAISLNNLAGLYQNNGEYHQALPLYQQAMQIVKEQLGENHPNYPISLRNLAALHKEMYSYEKALTLYAEVLEIFKNQYGDKDINYANILHEIAGLFKETEDYRQALPLYEQALEITKDQLGDNHFQFACTLNNLAGVYENMGDYEQALSLYEQALDIFKVQFSENHHYYVYTLYNIEALRENIAKPIL